MDRRRYLGYQIPSKTIDSFEKRLLLNGISSWRAFDYSHEPVNADIFYGKRKTACQICKKLNGPKTFRCTGCDAIIFKKNVNGRHKDRIKYMQQYTEAETDIDKERKRRLDERRVEARTGRR